MNFLIAIVISQRRKFLLKSKYDRFVLRTLYLFLVLNVLMVAVVAGSYFEVFGEIFDHPGS